MEAVLRSLARRFEIPGRFLGSRPLGRGHIHETFVATYAERGGERRYVHQRLNTRVFTEPQRLMENVVRITDHLGRKLAARGVSDADRRRLVVIPARDGRPWSLDAEGGTWRTFRYVEGTRSCDTIEGTRQAYVAGRAFGEFALLLSDLPPPPLAVTIPNFHDLAKRFADLEAAIRADAAGRAAAVSAEIDQARRHRDDLAAALRAVGAGDLPRRIVHNDCKLNNLLLDAETGDARCVIDLDTVMDGTLACDFGELVRTGTCASPEDERDLASMRFDADLFAAIAQGYLAGLAGLATPGELRALPLAGPALTLENAIRFLTDHLEGDVYFRIHRAGHNLDRCRAQLRLLALQMAHREAARQAVERAAGD
jgi:Ser/Thr protein kinase RdoA (MazF antagonist)